MAKFSFLIVGIHCTIILYFLYSANDMKIFTVLSESPLKVRKIAIYRFLMSFLVPEILRPKDLKNYQKNGTKNARS